MSPLMLPMAKDSQKDLSATSICRVGEAPPSTYTETTSLLFTATMVWYLDGTALIEDRLNHRFIEMDPKAPELCRVRCGNVSIFIKKKEVLKLYGERKAETS